MSHQVAPAMAWESAQRQHRPEAPFLTYARDGAAKIVHVVVEAGDEPAVLRCTGFGRALASDIAQNPKLTLLWPAASDDAFSLLADGYGEIIGDLLIFTIESAVLHRPAPLTGADACR